MKFNTASANLKCHSYTSTVPQHTAGKYVRYLPAHTHTIGRRKICDVNENFYSETEKNLNCTINQLPVEKLKIQL
jgi:hypothetical protein